MPRFAPFALLVQLLLLLLGGTAAVAETTRTLWSKDIVPLAPTMQSTLAVPPFDGRHVIVPQGSGSIMALDVHSGAVQWTYNGLNETNQTINQISVIPTQAVIVWAASGIVALDLHTGEELWSNSSFSTFSVLATPDAVLLYGSSWTPYLVALSTSTGAILYRYTFGPDTSISVPTACGLDLACWAHFPNNGTHAEAVVFDLKSGTVRYTTPLPISSSSELKDLLTTASHTYAVYQNYIDTWRVGIAIAAIDLLSGAVVWSYDLPQAAASGSYPASTGDGVVTVLIDLADDDGVTTTVNLLAFDQRTGAVTLNSTTNYTTTNPFPTFSETHEGRIWVGQVIPPLNLTGFDMATGQTIGSLTAPTSNLPPVYIAGKKGPRWVVPNPSGLTVWSGLTGAFESSVTAIEGIMSVQAATDGLVIVTTNTSVIALQP